MVIYYVHPLTTLCIVLVVVSLIAGLIASLNGFAEMIVNSGELTKSFKTSGKVAGWCLLLIAIGIIGMAVLNHNQDRPLSSIDSYISVEGSTVTIEALPNYHKYSTLDNDTHPDGENRQVSNLSKTLSTSQRTLSQKTVVNSNSLTNTIRHLREGIYATTKDFRISLVKLT